MQYYCDIFFNYVKNQVFEGINEQERRRGRSCGFILLYTVLSFIY